MAIRPAEQILHKAAWLYYTHGLRQDEVAKHLDISRASVAMYPVSYTHLTLPTTSRV